MVSIKTKRSDVIWSYIGSIVPMCSSFALLPFLIAFLSSDELGLWYVFLAVAVLAQLFEFGFSPAFARNIVYCLSGAKRLSKEGCESVSSDGEVDWHLFRTLLKVSRLLYAVIASIVLLGMAIVGTAYVSCVTQSLSGMTHWVAWALFCLSIFLNLYYLHFVTLLSGIGDIAGESRSKTYSSLVQLLFTGIFLFSGLGLIAAAAGYLAKGLSLRLWARHYVRRRVEITEGIAKDAAPVRKAEVRQVFASISYVAWRNGLDQLALYASTQGSSIVCSLCLGLAETGIYSLSLQFANALVAFAYAFVRSHYPMYQSAYARSDKRQLSVIVERGISMYWLSLFSGVVAVLVIAIPMLKAVRPDLEFDYLFFLVLAAYMALLQHHTIFCNFILASNRIPFLWGFVLSSLAGLVLSVVSVQMFQWGMWGLVFGQALPQLAFNNWYWPHYVMAELDTSFGLMIRNGLSYWVGKCRALVACGRKRSS